MPALVVLSTALLPATGARADPDPACQRMLEAAILRITSSGPMRMVITEHTDGTTAAETIVAIVPPERFQEITSMPGGPSFAIRTRIGGTIYSNAVRTRRKARQPHPLYAEGSLADYAEPRRFFATACSGASFDLEYNPFHFEDARREGLSADGSVRYKAFKAEGARLKATFAAMGGVVLREVPTGTLTLDGAGRPVSMRLRRDLRVIANETSVTVTYDPTLTIDPPR